ncbi:unnamed protein product [Symbiodinium sp. KB8]|nr:unnamed protein product [Symbiodinium sp. KB8]
MLSMQQNMKQELAAIEEHLSMRSNDFEASLRAAANANHDAVHTLFASHSQEVEALYARSAACEEGLQDLQTQSLLLAEWKDGASSDLFECARRLTEVEKAAKEFTDRISTGPASGLDHPWTWLWPVWRWLSPLLYEALVTLDSSLYLCRLQCGL